jgi:hypothetical protein
MTLESDGVAKILYLLRCAPRRKCPWGTKFLFLRRALVHRNDRNISHLTCEDFCKTIPNFYFLQSHQV